MRSYVLATIAAHLYVIVLCSKLKQMNLFLNNEYARIDPTYAKKHIKQILLNSKQEVHGQHRSPEQ